MAETKQVKSFGELACKFFWFHQATAGTQIVLDELEHHTKCVYSLAGVTSQNKFNSETLFWFFFVTFRDRWTWFPMNEPE